MAAQNNIDIQPGLAKVPEKALEDDPIPNQILLFLKHLCNKKVINIECGNCSLPETIWQFYFDSFCLKRKINFKGMQVSFIL